MPNLVHGGFDTMRRYSLPTHTKSHACYQGAQCDKVLRSSCGDTEDALPVSKYYYDHVMILNLRQTHKDTYGDT